MIKKTITICLKDGLHIRPAKEFVKVAAQFKSDVFIMKNTHTVNGKSILGIMSMAIKQGDEVILSVEGIDETEAATLLEQILIRQEGKQ